MSREFPDFVDPWKAADGRRIFQGTMPLKRMSRLEPLLAAGWQEHENGSSATPAAEFTARFEHDEQGTVTIDLEVGAQLPLLCQRSLAAYREPVERRSLLAVIQHVSEQEQLPENYEPVLVEQGRLALLDIVEEELLLAVPQVPRNPEFAEVSVSTDEGETPVRDDPQPQDERTHRPFEGLADLMKNLKTED